MNPNHRTWVWLLIVVFFAFTTYYAARRYKQERDNRIRLEQSFRAANQQLEYYKAKNGDLVAKNEVLQLKYDELKDIYPGIIEELRNLRVNPRHTEMYSETAIQSEKDIKVPLRDSIIYDTIPVKVFSYSDEFYDIRGMAVNDTQQVHIESRDSLIQVVYRGERENPWMWIFSRRKLQQVISCKNPADRITYSKVITLKK